MDRLSKIGAALFGVSIIGMLDGIIFHQILQWHSVIMHTDRVHQIKSDGFFHLFVTLIMFISGILLWKGRAQASPPHFWGCFLAGAGAFNLIEGITNHHLLEIHHVNTGPYQLWFDLGYDLFALFLLGIGWLLLRRKHVQAAY